MADRQYLFQFMLLARETQCDLDRGRTAVADAAIGQLESLGVTPDHLVVTHPHSDHLTGLDILRRHYLQATLISGQGAADFFMHPKSAQAITLEDRHMNERLDALGWQSDRPPVGSPPLEANFDVMVDEAVLDLGGITVQFIETYGHTPSSLAVWVPEKELLVASDALGFRYLDGSFLPLFLLAMRNTCTRWNGWNPMVPKLCAWVTRGR